MLLQHSTHASNYNLKPTVLRRFLREEHALGLLEALNARGLRMRGAKGAQVKKICIDEVDERSLSASKKRKKNSSRDILARRPQKSARSRFQKFGAAPLEPSCVKTL